VTDPGATLLHVPMILRSELLRHVRDLGREFARRGMPEVRALRLYYLAVRDDLIPYHHRLEIKWSEALALEWMRTLRVPPFESAYPVRPFGSACEACGGVRGQARGALTDCVFPGGARMRCHTCDPVWLEETRP
jgi:hypothetical protein